MAEQAAAKAKRHRKSITVEEVLDWMRSRPGISWIVTVNDIEHVLDEIEAESR